MILRMLNFSWIFDEMHGYIVRAEPSAMNETVRHVRIGDTVEMPRIFDGIKEPAFQ